MKNFQKKLLCGIFTASLVFTSGCITYTKDIGKLSSSTADSSYSSSSNDTSTSKYYTHLEHKDIPLSDRSRDSFDKDLFNSYCDNFKKALETSGNEETLTANYDLIKKELCNLSTDSFLALYDYYLDVDNEENSNISAKKDELYRNEFSNACSLFKEALSSDYADSFTEYIGSDLAESLADFTDLTDEENQLLDKQTELEQKYDSLSSADADYDQIKQLYIDIIKNNNEIANYYGCDNYAEYAYSQLYFRDFTIDDISSISDDVINNILPLFAAYCDDVLNNGTIDNIYIENTDTGNIKFSNLRSCIETISPELTASLDHLLKNNLYDVDYSKNKLSLGFTADLPSYNDGYIYYLPSYTLSDYSTIVHEFGHYNHIYNTESDYCGTGSAIIQKAVEGTADPWAFLLKMIFTAVTLCAGFKGGEIVPTFFAGATFGCIAGPIIGLSPSFSAALGIVSVFCGVTNCPLTSIILSYELFGGKGVPLFALSCAIAYMMSGYWSLYGSQKVVYSKTKAIFINKDTH